VFFDCHAVFINFQRTLGFEGLKFGVKCYPSDWQFSASMRLVPLIMPILTEEVRVVPEILPALRDLILHGSRSFPESFLQDVIEPFVAARQVLGNPVVVDLWY
jgi:hypothetical protein